MDVHELVYEINREVKYVFIQFFNGLNGPFRIKIVAL